MWRSIWQLLFRWLLVDRIRISPNQGKLLQLKVGDRICIRDRLWLVTDRKILREEGTSTATPLELQYKLNEDGEEHGAFAMLHVPFAAGGHQKMHGVFIVEQQKVCDVDSDELVILRN